MRSTAAAPRRPRGRASGCVRDLDQAELDVVDRQRLLGAGVEARAAPAAARAVCAGAPASVNAPPRCAIVTSSAASIWRRFASSGPHRFASARLSSGASVISTGRWPRRGAIPGVNEQSEQGPGPAGRLAGAWRQTPCRTSGAFSASSSVANASREVRARPSRSPVLRWRGRDLAAQRARLDRATARGRRPASSATAAASAAAMRRRCSRCRLRADQRDVLAGLELAPDRAAQRCVELGQPERLPTGVDLGLGVEHARGDRVAHQLVEHARLQRQHARATG